MGITRRDFLDGVALALAGGAANAAIEGQTDEASALAHAQRDAPERFRDAVAERNEGLEDLVVVGAGLSGLAGAYWFVRHAGRPVRVLVLDALATPGGHAQRNEFVSRSGRRMVGYGGSQSLESPSLFSPAVKSLLQDLGIALKRFETEFFDAGWAERQGVQGRILLFEAPHPPVVIRRGEKAADWLPRTPLAAEAQASLLRVLTGGALWPALSREARRDRLASITYRGFLLRQRRLHADAAALYAGATRAYFGVGSDATSALDAWALGLPGFAGLDLGDEPDPRMSPSGRLLKVSQDEYVHHFPDGNAGVVRALLRALIPDSVPGQGMESLADAPLVAEALDRAGQPVRVRQRATVVGLRHLGHPPDAVALRYVDARGVMREVRAKQVLLALWHRGIPGLTDELSGTQRRALADQVKVPLVYGTVLVSNWRAWQRAGVNRIQHPGGFWGEASLDFPVSMGSVRFPQQPDEPMLLHFSKVVVPGDGTSARAQAAVGRKMLAGWSFEHFEREVRSLLTRALGPFGFDTGDIEAITINRWSHGYAYEYMRPWDRYWPDGALPVQTARRGWGRVAIAGSDSGAYAYAHSAIDQAARAVQELLPEARLPAFSRFPGPPWPGATKRR